MAAEPTTPDVARLYEILGQRVRQVRERQQLKQEDLATRVGVSRATITQVENGQQKVHLQSLYLIAAALGAAIADILPTVGELSSTDRDILSRVSNDPNLKDDERAALTEFFGRLVPSAGGR